MTALKVLVIPASLRNEAPDARLASAVTRELIALDAEVTRISLGDFPLPIYDASLDGEPGPSRTVNNLSRMMAIHHGVFIAAPEYNASMPPLLKNAIDWIACLSDRNDGPAPFRDRAFAIGSASDDTKGGEHCLTALRQVLTLGCGATVIPRQISVSLAGHAFDELDRLRELHDIEQLKASVKQLVDFSQRMR
jgi:NAD(P)H-dependent FMN reductase